MSQLWKLAVGVPSPAACQNHDNIHKNQVWLLPSHLVALTLLRGLPGLQPQLTRIRRLSIPAAGSGPVRCQLGVNSQMGGDGLFSSIEKAFQGYVLGQVYETVLQK